MRIARFILYRGKRISGAIKKSILNLLYPIDTLPDAPILFGAYRQLYKNPGLKRKPGGWLYMGKFYPDYLTVGGCSHAILREALKFCHGQGIDVGAGLWPLPGAIPVDTENGPGVGKKVSDFKDGSLDYIFSSHCLEHIENWGDAINEWNLKLKEGGIIFLYLPHPDCAIWHPGSPIVGDSHKWIPRPDIMKESFQNMGFKIIQFDDGPDAMQSFHVCFQKQNGKSHEKVE